jgi:hypothetical protein
VHAIVKKRFTRNFVVMRVNSGDGSMYLWLSPTLQSSVEKYSQATKVEMDLPFDLRTIRALVNNTGEHHCLINTRSSFVAYRSFTPSDL